MSKLEKMMAKSRRENPIEHPAGSTSSASVPIDFKELHRFQNEWNAADGQALQYKILRGWWPNIQSVEPMPFDRHFLLIHSRIGYELQGLAYLKAGVKMPPSVQRNLDAIRTWSIGLMTDNVRRMLRIEIERNPQQQGDDDMAKKAVGKSKGTKQGVNQFYLEVFENQAKAQLTDLQIQAAIKAKTGNEPTFKNIASYRNAYNNGRLQGQKACPIKVKAVRPKKERIKKPMSEETKAKLKAYTEAKKKSKVTAKKK